MTALRATATPLVLDANILIYAYDSAASLHVPAKRWVERVFSSTEPVAVPLQTATAFLRIMTNARFPGLRYTVAEALAVVDLRFEQPNVRLLLPGEDQWPLLRQLLLEGHAAGPMVTDAQLAAATMECGGVLQTTDRGFSRFPGLRWANPLA